jgi:hypothetical protein
MLVLFVFTLAAQLLNDPPCTVTVPNGISAADIEQHESSFGNSLLSTFLYSPIIFRPNGPGFVTRDGALGMKFGWYRGAEGKLRVTGHRLDGEAPPAWLDLRYERKGLGFQASYLIFPAPGCWEVTGQLGDIEESKLVFVTKVVKIGDGPVRWTQNERRASGDADPARIVFPFTRSHGGRARRLDRSRAATRRECP